MQTENVLNDLRLRALENHTRVNLLRPTLGTTTVNGVTCTANGDGTYTLNGTATSPVLAKIGTVEKLNKNLKYKILGALSNENPFTYGIRIGDINNNFIAEAYIDGVILDGANYIISLEVVEGFTCENILIKPMLTSDLDATYDDFVSYEDSLVTGSSQYFFGGVDTSRVLASGLALSSEYTATEDCYILLQKNQDYTEKIIAYIDGVNIMKFVTSNAVSGLFPLKAGQVVTGENVFLIAYGVKR